ncbi:MAG: NUDIX domain-containing protein [Candidatus Pacebacteria bacterium]|jgi:8-oxo-dGTP pyrophosphatase MutT (NUDIX family)|nr:NUDIX domain-containing protein [Candidatus Paceibacterota bacterium]
MKRTKACAIIADCAGRLLLQLRDEDPEKNTWVLFGGGVHDGETEEQALRREIAEELDYNIKKATFLMRYDYNDTKQAIFVVVEPVERLSLELREGAAMGFFSAEEIEGLSMGFNFKEILLKYLNGKA